MLSIKDKYDTPLSRRVKAAAGINTSKRGQPKEEEKGVECEDPVQNEATTAAYVKRWEDQLYSVALTEDDNEACHPTITGKESQQIARRNSKKMC
jgi:hypothetical protein